MIHLVTGGAGFIGHNVVKKLEFAYENCIIVDNFTNYNIIKKEEIDFLRTERKKKYLHSNNHACICFADDSNLVFFFVKFEERSEIKTAASFSG